jgi:hypothetical protein
MPHLKIGDRVTVKIGLREFCGKIVGEGRQGLWWIVLKDGTKYGVAYHKDFCRHEPALKTAQGKDPT